MKDVRSCFALTRSGPAFLLDLILSSVDAAHFLKFIFAVVERAGMSYLSAAE